MSTTGYPHVEVIEGRAWIEGRKVRVTEIVLDWLAWHWDAEQIHLQHPHLSMAEIHAAFLYYYDHKEELDRQISEELEKVKGIREQTQNVKLQARLRALRKAQSAVS
jgi:uncharacterized protein (DUF433 family)